MFVNTKKMLMEARKKHYMVIGAECWSLESARAHIDTAAELNMPLIVMLWEGAPEPMAGFEPICDYVRFAAGKTQVPIAMHLDHAHSVKTVERAIKAGFTSVMLDASNLPFEDNVSTTREVVKMAAEFGVTVEAELGHVGGASCECLDPETSGNTLTIPEEAAKFIRQTGVDSLAVSVGTVHGIYKGKPHLDMERLKAIYKTVDVPLVLHGGSGTGIDILRQTAQYGISKLNVMTDLITASKRSIAADCFFPEIAMYNSVKKCLKNYMTELSKPV